jgi:hypothetical protein
VFSVCERTYPELWRFGGLFTVREVYNVVLGLRMPVSVLPEIKARHS